VGGKNGAGSWCDDDVTMRVWSICLKARQSRRQWRRSHVGKKKEDRDRAGGNVHYGEMMETSFFLLNHFSLMASLMRK
jgi:hypothetical protein